MATFKGESDDGTMGWEFNLPDEPLDVYKVQQLIVNTRIALGMLRGEQLYNTAENHGREGSSIGSNINEHFAQNIFCELDHMRGHLSDRNSVLHREVNFAPLADRFERVLMPLVEVARLNRWQETAHSNPECLDQLVLVIAAGREYLRSRGFEEEDLEEYAERTDWLDKTPSF